MTSVAGSLDLLGIDYTIRGDEAIALCPNHNDSHPSWSVNLDSGLHHCFSCGYSGNLRGLVARTTGKGWGDAGIWLKRNRAVQPSEPRTAAKEPEWKYSEASLVFFDSPPAEALAARGLSAAACQAYQILWNQQTEGWVFPIRDPKTGKLRGWQEKNERCFRNRPRTVAKSEALFGLQSLEPGGTAVVVESPADAARLHTAGISGGVSCFGSSVSDHQLSALFRRAGRIVLALDDDRAGVRETARLLRRLVSPGISVFNYGVVAGKDLDPGNLDDDQLRWGVGNAWSALAWRLRYC